MIQNRISAKAWMAGCGKVLSSLLTTTLSLGLATSACTEVDEVIVDEQKASLSLNVCTAGIQSRGLIESALLPDGHSIGVTMVDAGGERYDNILYSNIKATASVDVSPQTWTLDGKVLLSGTEGTVYAYYPYNTDVTDVSNVPVSAGETDYMYATPVTGLDDGNEKAKIVMNHALAAIRLSIVKGTYQGTGEVTNVSVMSDNLSIKGILDATTGEVTPDMDEVAAINRSCEFTVTATAHVEDFIFVPVEELAKAPSFAITIDGNIYTTTAAETTIEQGSVYNYTLTVDAKELELSDVTVGNWGYDEAGYPVINCGYKITLAGDTEGIAFSNTVNDDGSVIIKAVPENYNYNVNEVTVGSGATLSQKFNEGTGIRYITLTDISTDVTVTFNGTVLPLQGTIDLTTAANGVYAVAKNRMGVIYEDADESCIAVALIVNDAPTPQRLMIEKYGESNTTSIKAAYTADGASNTDYTYFYWGMYNSDNSGITNYTQVGGGLTTTYGYLPKADGSYASTSNNLSSDYTTWTSGTALGDFNGKANTAAIQSASDTDGYTTYANMGTYCTKFNATASENQGYTDWYIPACGQLSLMYLNMTAINNALTKIGGQTIASYSYWSSSEYSSSYGWIVGFDNGYVSLSNKTNRYRVRFVRDF